MSVDKAGKFNIFDITTQFMYRDTRKLPGALEIYHRHTNTLVGMVIPPTDEAYTFLYAEELERVQSGMIATSSVVIIHTDYNTVVGKVWVHILNCEPIIPHVVDDIMGWFAYMVEASAIWEVIGSNIDVTFTQAAPVGIYVDTVLALTINTRRKGFKCSVGNATVYLDILNHNLLCVPLAFVIEWLRYFIRDLKLINTDHTKSYVELVQLH